MTILLILLSILLVVVFPIAVIYLINFLFNTSIPVNIKTWAAVMILRLFL